MKLMARMEIGGRTGREYYLSVYDNQGAVGLQLVSTHTPYCLSSLQAKGRAPAFWDPKNPRETLRRIREWVETGLYKVTAQELHPEL